MTYEYPFNETVRSLLRLEYLFHRFEIFLNSDEPEHHLIAITLLFDLAEVTSRADLKLSVLKEFDRQKAFLNSLRTTQSINQSTLEKTIADIETSSSELNQLFGKPNVLINESEWLNMIRSRINVPGGTSPVDLPSFYNWQQLNPQLRKKQLMNYTQAFAPWKTACQLFLKLLRDSGESHPIEAAGGSFQQMLAGRTYQLIRIDIEEWDVIPEISANKHMLWIRFLLNDNNGKPQLIAKDIHFKLTLCNL
jgi:cell division protein ZapD